MPEIGVGFNSPHLEPLSQCPEKGRARPHLRYVCPMRPYLCLILSLCAAPAVAWEVTVGPICVLEHQTDEAKLRLTYDPAKPEYTISVTRAQVPWPRAASYTITYDGQRKFRIGTDQHVLSQQDRTLTVTNSGFDNVLNGLAGGGTATAATGSAQVVIPLAGAAPAVETFRRCAPIAGV